VEGGVARFDWPGVRISFRTRGPGFRLLLGGTGPDFNVLVDGQPWTKLITWGADGYDLWLPDAGVHDVTLVRRQGPLYGPTRFEGLLLLPGTELLPPPPRRARRVEFVGDSLTVGYGVDALWPVCEDLRPYEDSAKAFASLAADALGAEPWIAAASGHGLVRNFGDPAPRSARSMTALYGDALFGEAGAWSGAPSMDAVVVFLGTNDLSTEPGVPPDALLAGFRELLGRIRGLHGAGVPIFLLADGAGGPLASAVAAVAASEVAGGRRSVHVVTLPPAVAPFGCDAHPGPQTHQAWAETLAAAMREALGWATAAP
jgi:lysophospholipase L1-like esterase